MQIEIIDNLSVKIFMQDVLSDPRIGHSVESSRSLTSPRSPTEG